MVLKSIFSFCEFFFSNRSHIKEQLLDSFLSKNIWNSIFTKIQIHTWKCWRKTDLSEIKELKASFVYEQCENN